VKDENRKILEELVNNPEADNTQQQLFAQMALVLDLLNRDVETIKADLKELKARLPLNPPTL